MDLLYIIFVCIIADYVSSAVHELSHCLTFVLLTKDSCTCFIPLPWFLPLQNKKYTIDIGKIKIVLSSTGPFSMIYYNNNDKLINILVLLNGPFFGLLTLSSIRYHTQIWIIDLLIIIDLVSNFYPCVTDQQYHMTDGLRIIKIYYPYFNGYNSEFSSLLMYITILYYIAARISFFYINVPLYWVCWGMSYYFLIYLMSNSNNNTNSLETRS